MYNTIKPIVNNKIGFTNIITFGNRQCKSQLSRCILRNMENPRKSEGNPEQICYNPAKN